MVLMSFSVYSLSLESAEDSHMSYHFPISGMLYLCDARVKDAVLSSHPLFKTKKLPSKYLMFLNQSVHFRLCISFTRWTAFRKPVIRERDPICLTRSVLITSSSQ